MKHYLPLILSALLTGALAGAVAWRQQMRITGLRDRIAARPVPAGTAPAPGQGAKPASSGQSVPRSLAAVLALTKSRSMLRTGQELVRHYQTCPLAGLCQALETLARTSRISSLETAGAFIIAMSALTERDTAAAVDVVNKIQGDVFVPAAIIVLNDWMLRDKKAALAWFHGLTNLKAKGQILTAASIFYGASNPQLVEEIRNGISPDSSELDKADNQAVEALASADPEAALARLDQVSDPELRHRIEETALMILARKEPAKALSMMALDAGPDSQKTSDNNVARVLMHFLQQDHPAASKWMAAQDPALITRLLAAEPALGTEAARSQ